MTASEMIELLKAMPPDCKVVAYDNEWGEYSDVIAVRARVADIGCGITDSTYITLYPEGDIPAYAKRKIGSENIVEVVKDMWRLEA